MDTDSTNNKTNPKSWNQLVAEAGKAEPPGDIDILDRVKQSIAEEVSVPEQATAPPGWLDELTALLELKWITAGLAGAAAAIMVLGWIAAGDWSEMSFAFDLDIPVWSDIL